MALSEIRPRIAVLGTECLWATHAICMTALGHEVLSIDSDKQKIAALPDGRSGRSAWCVHRVAWTRLADVDGCSNT
jgi:hypothetical protein